MRPGRIFALGALLCVAGCATETTTTQAASGTAKAAADTAPQCFFPRDVQNFVAVGDSVVMLRVGVNDVYRADLFAPCPEMRFSQGLAIRSTGGGGAICSALDAELVVPGGGAGRGTCLLNSIRKLTPQEVAALPPSDKP